MKKILLSVFVALTILAYNRTPEGTVIIEKHAIEGRSTIRFDPVTQQYVNKKRHDQYYLVISDEDGNIYYCKTGQYVFNKVSVGDSVYYNRKTDTLQIDR